MTSLGISLHTLDILNIDDFQYQVDPQGYIQIHSKIFEKKTKDVLKAIPNIFQNHQILTIPSRIP